MEAGGTTVDRYKPRGLTRVMRALGSSARGLTGAFRDEAAFRQELAFAVLVIPLGLWIVELLNSAIEATVDRIGFERHALAGLAKDIGSAAVFMSFVLLTAVWLLVLLGR